MKGNLALLLATQPRRVAPVFLMRVFVDIALAGTQDMLW
jgi:hypothetical protein